MPLIRLLVLLSIIVPLEAGLGSPPLDGSILREIRVTGTRGTDPEMIRRVMSSRVGQPVSEMGLGEDYRRLDRLGLYSQIEITPVPLDDGVRLDVHVRETLAVLPYPSFSVTDEHGLTAGAGIKATNFLKRGIYLSAAARFGGAKEVSIDARSPWRPYPSTWAETDYSYRNRLNKLEDFHEHSQDVEVSIGRQLLPSLRAGGLVHFLSMTSDMPGVTLSDDLHDNIPGFGAVLESDTRDRSSNPRAGWNNSIDFLWNGVGGDGDYQTFNFDIRRYQPIKGRHGTTISGLLTLQTGELGTDIPLYQRFHIGGENTVRGWDLDARSGKNQLLGTVEYRYELLKVRSLQIKGFSLYVGVDFAAFADLGSAWSDDAEFSKNTIGGGGLGLRILIPYFNLLRIDFSLGQSGTGVHSGVGIDEKTESQRRRVR